MSIESLSYEQKIALANNPNTSSADFTDLVNDSDKNVRAAAAGACDRIGLLSILVRDAEPDVRVALAKNVMVAARAPEMFLEIVKDEDASVLCAAAQNHNAGEAALTILAGHENPDVRLEVAKNRWAPAATLKELKKDKFADVRQAAVKTLRWQQSGDIKV